MMSILYVSPCVSASSADGFDVRVAFIYRHRHEGYDDSDRENCKKDLGPVATIVN